MSNNLHNLHDLITKSPPDAVALALRAALERWREKPSATTAELVEQLAVLARSSTPPRLEGDTEAERIDSWIALEKRGSLADLDLLVDSLSSFRCADALPLLKKLQQRWAPDPRITRALCTLLRQPPRRGYWGNKSAPFWRTLCKLLVANGDRRSLAELKQQADTVVAAERRGDGATSLNTILSQRLPPCVRGLEKLPAPEPDEQEHASLEKLLAIVRDRVVQERGPDSDELLRRIYAAPDNDEWPLVLADLLQERGDPRGEFIVLQRLAKPDAKQKARLKALEKQHGREWLGPLASAVQAVRYAGGFPYRCSVDVGEPTILRQVIGLPEWGTVRELRLTNVDHWDRSPVAGEAALDFLLHPVMRSVRLIHELPLAYLDRLAEDRPLQHLHLWDADTASLVALARNKHLPALRELSFQFGTGNGPEAWIGLFASDTGKQLQKVTVDASQDSTALLQLLPDLPPRLQQLVSKRGWDGDDLAAQIKRVAPEGFSLQLSSELGRRALLAALRRLSPGAIASIREVRLKQGRGRMQDGARKKLESSARQLLPDAKITVI